MSHLCRKVALGALVSAALVAVSSKAYLPATLAAEEKGAQWPVPPIERYQPQTPNTEVSMSQILAIIAERDRQYGQRFDAQEKAVINALAAAEKAVTTAMAAAEKAVIKAEGAAEKRFEAVNEFRAQLRDQAGTFMGRAESSAKFNDIERRLDNMEQSVNKKMGESQGAQNTWGWIVGAGGFLLAAVTLFLRNRNATA